MGVFEPPATEIEASNRAVSPSERPRSNTPATVASGSNSLPPGRARFIQHQTRQSVYPDNDEAPEGLPYLPRNEFMASSDHSEGDHSLECTADVVDDILRSVHNSTLLSSTTGDNVQTKSSLIHRHPSSHEPDAPESDAQSLLSNMNHTYPPDVVASSSSVGHMHTVRPAIGRVRARVSFAHSPIPAITVFSRKAATLFLPKLDDYLATLPPPRFSSFGSRGKSKNKDIGIFAPMDRLVSLGKTLEDLETNSTILPFWKNRKTLLGGLVNLFLGIMGSSALASYYSLQGLFNTVQVFALILSTIVPRSGVDIADKWRKLVLGTIPNIVALNFASTLNQSLVFLLIFMAITAIMLFSFYRWTSEYHGSGVIEGLQPHKSTGRRSLVFITFLLTVIYLPLSTMAVHVLVWSQDLWVVSNPYVNATSFPPVLPPLGPPDQFRDPLDFCWTTTMKRNDVNFAPVFVIIAIFVFLSLTIWFPLRLRRVIMQAMPLVDPFTELGKPRSKSDMDREYQRLLARDPNPFAFLYKDFRRQWGTYRSTYLLAKLSILLIIAVIDPDNCLFRTLPRNHVGIVRQVVLLLVMLVFFLIQCLLAPFLDPVNNASEFTSRINYVLTAALSLGVALNIPGKAVLTGPLLYVVYVVTYGLSAYFFIIDLSVMHTIVKKLARRIDFSIDIFSPRLDISPSSLHTRRRIWQEAITTLFLTSPECEIPKEQTITFAQAPEAEYPPYLLDFAGSPSERHVENLKILREVGLSAYNKAANLIYGSDCKLFRNVEEQIQDQFVGPDCYWKNPAERPTPGCTKFFGNGWWIPFPPTLVIRYDDGPLKVLREMSDLELYISQNSNPDVQRSRQIRMALRALNGQRVTWPYVHTYPIGARFPWSCGGKRYKVQTSVLYKQAVLRIKNCGDMMWRDLQLGSGLDIELIYDRDVQVDGGVFGLDDDYNLTPSLARFLALNQTLISGKLADIEAVIHSYRKHCKAECRMKEDVLSYRFLSFVYNQPRSPDGLAESSIASERDPRVRQLMVGSETIFKATYERLAVVATTPATTWWYIFWDDLWRRNYGAIKALQLHAPDFDPHYPTSIAYHPLPRTALQAFLTQRGLFHKVPQWHDFFHSGFLNKLYLRLNEVVFRGSSKAILFHMGGADMPEVDMEEIDFETLAGPSKLGTGGGTDHDDDSIRARPTYKWEGLLNDPLRRDKRWRRRWFAKMGVWFGITPLWRMGMPSEGISLDVRLEDGRYVLIKE